MEEKYKNIILHDSNVISICKVDSNGEEFLTNFDEWAFPIKNKCELILNLEKKEVIELKINGESFVFISKEYYDLAKKILKCWNKEKIEVYAKEKDSPVLLCKGEGLGFILAPRNREEE